MHSLNVSHRDAPGVFLLFVDCDTILTAREHLAESADPEWRRGIGFAHHLFELFAKSWNHSEVRWQHTALHAGLNAVTANEFLLTVAAYIPKLRDIDAVCAPIVIVIRVFCNGWNNSAQAY